MKPFFRTSILNLAILACIGYGISVQSAASAGGTDPYGREDPNKKVLKNGLLGAGTGAIAAEASGGEAGKGALIGAGTNVIGGALLDVLTAPSAPPPAPVYAAPPAGYSEGRQPQKKIIRKFDANGKVIEEQEVWE